MCIPCVCGKSPEELYQLGIEHWNRLPKDKRLMFNEHFRRDAKTAIKSITLLRKAADQRHALACIEVAKKVFACNHGPWSSHGGVGSNNFSSLVNKSLGKVQRTFYRTSQDEIIHHYLILAEKFGSPGTQEMRRLLGDETNALAVVAEQEKESRALSERVRQGYIRDHAQEIMMQNSEDSLNYQRQQLRVLEDISRKM